MYEFRELVQKLRMLDLETPGFEPHALAEKTSVVAVRLQRLVDCLSFGALTGIRS